MGLAMANRDSVLLAFYGRQRSDAGEDDPRNSSGAQSIGPVHARTDRPWGGHGRTGRPSRGSDKTNVASICGRSLLLLGGISFVSGPDPTNILVELFSWVPGPWWLILWLFLIVIPLGLLGFLSMTWDSRKQGWHDKIAGTRVLRLPPRPEELRRKWLLKPWDPRGSSALRNGVCSLHTDQEAENGRFRRTSFCTIFR